MIYFFLKRTLVFLVLFLLLFSCSEDTETSETLNSDKVNIDSISLSDELELKEGEMKMFTMPTPIQTAAALKVLEVEYADQLLLENSVVASNSDIDLSLILGMYMVDLGYTTIYNNSQKSLNYADDIQNIMEELPIGYYVNDAFRVRFKNNLNNQDSLCKIILDGYNDANQYITENKNEGIGLLILTGAYIESLYLITNSNVKSEWKKEYNNLFIQQKLFLENFTTILAPYAINEQINSVVTDLNELNKAFSDIEIKFSDNKQEYELLKPISEEQKDKIRASITSIRNKKIQNAK